MAGGHRLPKGDKVNRSGKRGGRGTHRSKPTRPEPYAWLGVGALTLGLGAALTTGAGVAYAEEGTASGGGQTSSPSGQGSAPDKPSTGPSSPKSGDDDDKTPGPTISDGSDDDDDDDSTDDDSTDDTDSSIDDDADDADDAGADDGTDDDDDDDSDADDEDEDEDSLEQTGTDTGGSKSDALKPALSARAEVYSAAAMNAGAGTVVDEASAESGEVEGPAPSTPDVAPTQTMPTAKTVSMSASSTLAAADEPAPEPIPKAIAIPVVQLVGGFLNLFGVNTNSPLPPLDIGLAAAWTWFRQLQTEWGIAPPTGAGVTTSEPDPETGVITGSLSANNPSGLPLTYKVAIDPLLGDVTLNSNGTFTYTPSEAARLAAIIAPVSDVFTVTVSNGIASNYSLVTVPISASAAGTPSIPGTVSQSTNSSTGLVTGQVGSTGPAGHTITYQVITSTLGGQLTFNNATGEYTYQPSALSMALAGLGIGNLTDVFTVVAKNGSLTSLPGVITVPITAGNATPGAPTSVSQSTNPTTGLVSGQLSATDPAGQPLTFQVITSTLGGQLTLNGTTGAYTYQPSALSMALASLGGDLTDVFTVVATNGTFTSLPAIITVPITAVDATPSSPTSVSQSTNPNTGLVTGQVGATDPAGQQLHFTVIPSTLGGQLTFNNATGAYTYQPSALSMALAEAGLGSLTDAFTVVASNGTFTSLPAIITVPITAADGKPGTPVGGAQSTNALTGVVTGSVSATDPIGDGVTFDIITSTLQGTLNFDEATGAYTYTPSAAARALASTGVTIPDVFTVVAQNAAGTSSIATISVPIAPNPSPPSTPTKTNQVVNSSSGLVTGTLVSTDPNGLPLTYSLTIPGIQGSYTVSANGNFTFQPTTAARTASWAAGGNLSDVFTVTVTNGISSASAIITVPVSPKAPSWPF